MYVYSIKIPVINQNVNTIVKMLIGLLKINNLLSADFFSIKKAL